MPRNLLVAIVAASMLALLLSFVPALTSKEADVPAFRESRPVGLNEQNVVDLFTLVPTHYNIKRVKWENQSVFVDFVVRPAQKVELSLVYRDFYTLSYDLFRFTDNTKRVYYRLLEEEQTATARLLVAIEAKRSQTEAYKTSPDEMQDVQAFVEKTFPVRIDPYFRERVIP
jgi:hypothetical protein